MRTHFTKMHGNGNDFVLFDGQPEGNELSTETVRRLADRRLGIGFDQMLVARAPTHPQADVRLQIFNADGREAQQCGNGVRCFATFLRERGLVSHDDIAIEICGVVVTASLLADGIVRVNMGEPVLEPAEIPFLAHERANIYRISINGTEYGLGVASMGNPHAVLQVDDVDGARVVDLAPRFQADARFPEGVNVGFSQTIARDHIRLRVFERGVGETLACGSGACAAVVVGQLQGLLDQQVRVDLPGGSLQLAWCGPGSPVWMTGPTRHVFHGEVEL